MVSRGYQNVGAILIKFSIDVGGVSSSNPPGSLPNDNRYAVYWIKFQSQRLIVS